MKVLFAINGLGVGGAERSLAELLPLLRPAGIEPVVVCLYHRSEGVESRVLADGYDVRYVSAARTLPRALAFRRIIAAERPDLVHTTIFESNVTARLAAAGAGVPVLTSLVGTPYTATRLREDPLITPAKLRVVQAVDTWTAKRLTTHFHAITHAVKDWAVETMRIPAERITVIERGRDPARLGRPGAERRAAARARLGLRDDHEVVVNVGRQEYPKGQRYLLEAIEMLARSRPNLVLLLAGRDGNATAELRGLASRSALRDTVRFLGHRDDVPEILAAGDVFTFPSLYEGQGCSVVEAMALGLPLVLTDVPALREITDPGRNALLVELSSPRALARALAELLDDSPRRRSMGSRSREIFEERFTLDRSAQRTFELYHRLVAEGARPPVRERVTGR